MVLDEQAVIHPVELITGEDQVLVHIPFLEQPLVLAHSISGALEPGGAVRGLLRSQNLHEALAEGGAQIEGLAEMAVQ